MKAILKKVAASLTLCAMLIPSFASAATWMTPYGLVSDTCVTPQGVYMVFTNQYGVVGTGCSFTFYGNPTVFYGTWR